MQTLHDGTTKEDFVDWNGCLNGKIERLKPTECELKYIEQFRSWMREETAEGLIDNSISGKSFELSHKLTKSIVYDCKGSYDNAIKYFNTNISDL